MYIFNPSIITSAFRMLEFETICGKEYWAYDDSVLYAQGVHFTLLVAVAIPALLFYAILCPILALLYLGVHRDRQTNPKLLFRFGLLFSGYAEDYWWYEIFIYLRKLCIILIVTFASSNTQQLHIALGVLIVLLYLHENLQPFGIAASTTTNSLLHRMEASSLLILILMVWSAVFFVVNPCDDVDIVCSALGVSVLGVNIIFAVICTYVFLHSFGKRNKLSDKISMLAKAFSSSKKTIDTSGNGATNGCGSVLFPSVGSVKMNPLSNGKSRTEFSQERMKRTAQWCLKDEAENKDEAVIEMAVLNNSRTRDDDGKTVN